MTGPIDIHALKAAALDPTKHRTHDDRVMMVARSDVLALIERLETAEHRLMSLGYRRACDIPPCNCGDRWAHKLACPSKCSCDKCELDILCDELRADRARLEKLEAVATAARDLVSEDHAFEKTYSHCVTKTAFVAMRAALAALEAP